MKTFLITLLLILSTEALDISDCGPTLQIGGCTFKSPSQSNVKSDDGNCELRLFQDDAGQHVGLQQPFQNLRMWKIAEECPEQNLSNPNWLTCNQDLDCPPIFTETSLCSTVLGINLKPEGCYAIFAIAVILFILIFICVLTQIIKQRRGRNRRSSSEDPNSDTSNKISVTTGVTRQNISLDNPMTLKDIKIKTGNEDFKSKIESEFKTIEEETKKLKEQFRAGNRRENSARNISEFVLPYDSNRVKLNQQGTSRLSDYVNASWLRNLGLPYKGIVTGCPLMTKPPTLIPFFQMIIEYKVDTIILIFDPENPENEDLGDVDAALSFDFVDTENDTLSVKVDDKFNLQEVASVVQRDLTLTFTQNDKQQVQKVKHFHITLEPSVGTSTQEFLDIVETLMKLTESSETVVLQDREGIKLSAIYLAIQLLLKNEKEQKCVNVPKTVMSLRKERMSMIPTYEDYELLYKCMAVLYDRKEGNRNLLRPDPLGIKGRIGSVFRSTKRNLLDIIAKDSQETIEQFNLMGKELNSHSKSAGLLPANQIWNRLDIYT